MNALIDPNAPLTMSSREIAELCDKEHRNVLADIRKMLAELHDEEGLLKFQQTYIHPQNGQQYPEYVLPKDETLCLMAGYDVKGRMRIIKRWQELEAQAQHAIPKTLPEALRLAADQAEQIEHQQAVIEQQRPAVEFVDDFVKSDGLKGFRQAAKLLKANERQLRAFLEGRKIMYRLNGEWAAYQNHIDAGRFKVVTGTNKHNLHAFTKTMFTPKGIQWIAGLWGQQQVLFGDVEVMA